MRESRLRRVHIALPWPTRSPRVISRRRTRCPSRAQAVATIRTVSAFGREQPLLEQYRDACRGASAQGLALGRAKALLEATTAPIMTAEAIHLARLRIMPCRAQSRIGGPSRRQRTGEDHRRRQRRRLWHTV